MPVGIFPTLHLEGGGHGEIVFSHHLKPHDHCPNRLNTSQTQKRDSSIWQCRYWDHTMRDDLDLTNHVDDIHYTPIKHGWGEHSCD